jgi:hypothetical protein
VAPASARPRTRAHRHPQTPGRLGGNTAVRLPHSVRSPPSGVTVVVVGVRARLRQLDDRVVPDRGRGKYDSARPLWFLYGSVVGSLTGTAFTYGLFRVGGAAGTIMCSITGLVFIGYYAAAVRWHRSHRLRTPAGAIGSGDI